jgi:hypothetical protein
LSWKWPDGIRPMLDFLYLRSCAEGHNRPLARARPTGWEGFPVVACLPCLVLLSFAMPVRAEDPLPTGFKADRYKSLWERNPFTLVTPAAPIQSQTFSKLVVVSWLNEDGKDSLFIQDSDTNDVQKITDVPNERGLRIVEVHSKGGEDFQMIRDFEAVISNGSEQGTIKFKSPAATSVVASNPINPMQMRGEGATINPTMNQVPQQPNPQMPGANVQPTAAFTNPNPNANVPPPQTQQTRRKRVLPSAVANGGQGGVPVPQQQQQQQQQQIPQVNQGQ